MSCAHRLGLTSVLRRGLATAATPTPPPITASVLLSRHALLQPTPEPLAKAYYAYQTKLRHALSNPVPTDFYFKPGSLALRRFLAAEHAVEDKIYGSKIAGPTPDLGEIQPEPPLQETSRDHWEKADAERGERSLERFPEEEVFFVVQAKGKWTFPSTSLKAGEGLDEAVNQRITGVAGQLDGKGMDTWLVTRKPVGLVRNGEERVSQSRRTRPSRGRTLRRKTPYRSSLGSFAALTAELFPSLAHSRRRAQADQGVGLLYLGVAHARRDRGASAETRRRGSVGERQGHVWREQQGRGVVEHGS